jgi:hypothetical protein
MIAISTRELAQSGDKYFDLALTQPVFLKRHKRLFRLQVADGNDEDIENEYLMNLAISRIDDERISIDELLKA